MLENVNWLDKGLDYTFWIVTAVITFIYNWLHSKITKLEDRMNSSEKALLTNQLENTKEFVTRYDLQSAVEKLEHKIDRFDTKIDRLVDSFDVKIDKLVDSMSDLKEKLLTKV